MSATRDKDGNIIDERTVLPDDQTVRATDTEMRTAPSASDASADDYESRTVKVGDANPFSSDSPQKDDERTRIVGGRRRSERVKAMKARADYEDSMDDPVVGWLVVLAGPGKGRTVTLGYGVNSIGRANDERVRIDFGDDQISRRSHAIITYEPRSRKFYVQQGGGTNLVYLDGEAVLTPKELLSFHDIQLGNTTLRFVQFCGADFDWRDLEEAPSS